MRHMKPNRSTPTISAHKLARLIALAQLMLAWIGWVLFSANPPRPSRRRIRQRFRLLDPDCMARVIRHLVLARATQMARPTAKTRRRNHAPTGFQRRMRRGGRARSLAGSALRKRLQHRDLATRLSILAHALNRIDEFARDICRRYARGATRLYPILAVRPPHASARSVALAAALAAIDSS